MQLRDHADTQTVKRAQRYAICIYIGLNLECSKCTRIRQHRANCLVVLRTSVGTLDQEEQHKP